MVQEIEIKQLMTLNELREMQDLEQAVWNMEAPIPLHQSLTVLTNGGIILGAYDGNEMIGFLYSFPGFDGKQPYICSHMLGILPAYRSSGIGVKMKNVQANIAKQMGYAYITWTFDPLESRNAYVNLHKLGAVGAAYLENHYGELQDDLNKGMPTDRIQIVWDIEEKLKPTYVMDEQKLLVSQTTNGQPKVYTEKLAIVSGSECWFIAIPSNYQTLKQTDFELALQWRMAVRKAMQTLFLAQFQATNMTYDAANEISYYTFTKAGNQG